MKDAEKSWRLCSESVKNTWDMCASFLNKRSIPRNFARLPLQISIDGVEANLKIALQMDWRNFCKVTKKHHKMSKIESCGAVTLFWKRTHPVIQPHVCFGVFELFSKGCSI